MSEAAARLLQIRERLAQACERAGRSPATVRLVGVCKTFPAQEVAPVAEAGLDDLGENYVQEARDKIPQLPGGKTWHLIGPLQRNKVNLALSLFDWVHTIDREDLVRALDQRLGLHPRGFKALVQVRLGGEESKHGLEPEALMAWLESLKRDPPRHVRLSGLMTVPPPVDDAEESRPHYRRLRLLLEEIRAQGYSFWDGAELSMGMSDDYPVAVEEGATLVRVGRALFGPR